MGYITALDGAIKNAARGREKALSFYLRNEETKDCHRNIYVDFHVLLTPSHLIGPNDQAKIEHF